MVFGLAFAGCYSSGDVGVGYSYGYAAPAPSMYYVSDGVQVVAYDSDYPVFYSDGYYWRYDGGLWYRSGYYNTGFVVWNDVPYGVRGIREPYRYARFQPGQGWSRGGATYNASGGVDVRDHRTNTYYAPRTQTYAPPSGGPAVRDHRSAPVYTPAPASTARPAPNVRDHRTH